MTIKNINKQYTDETKGDMISDFLSSFESEVPDSSFNMAVMSTYVIIKTPGSTPVPTYTADSQEYIDLTNTSRSAMLSVIESQ